MLSFLALGFLIGLWHALEPDHVAAVVTISTRGGTLRDHARCGALWGVGHALTLVLLAGSCVLFGLVIPESAGRFLEGAVGVMLVVLGVSVFARLRQSGVHVHGHVHAGGAAHFHAHAHARGVDHAREPHAHSHAHRSLPALCVGAVHGLAGSSALALLAGSAARSPALGVAYVAFFGLGAIAGMMVLAATLALPLRVSARRRTGLYRLLCAGGGVFSIAIGLHLVWFLATATPG